jgi:hypothetical protein
MALNETDDLEQGGVQRCLAQPDPASVKRRNACQQNRYWKERLCGVLHKGQQKLIDACARDATMIPRFIERGGT